MKKQQTFTDFNFGPVLKKFFGIDSFRYRSNIYIYGRRLETDAELQQRILSIELLNEKEKQKKEKRRKEYLKLKEEFEK